ncbi:hypothetical protein AB0A95_24815 [Micromonospora sp. NPDC049230]|uniref:hypothetical protein n=1 Tax=Micromonospora sp. NPDC049230 TaxID=3155502 RepID=UPI003410A84E
MMMGDRLMREADPVADWRVDPESSQAQVMLAGILATSQNGDAERSWLAPERRRGVTRQMRRRRIALGGAATVAVALGTLFTLGSGGPNGAAAAYAITPKPDGAVELTVRWEQLDDVGGLAATLRDAGVPTELRSGVPASFCAPPTDRDRNGQALNQLGPNSEQISFDGYLMRPRLFPEGSTLVISTFSEPATQMTYTMLYLAPVGSPSCALNGPLGNARYTGPGPHPTRIVWPGP